MKQGHYVAIEGAFKNYRRNKRALDNYPYPYSAGIDYSKERVQGDMSRNVAEQMILSVIDERDWLWREVELVRRTLTWFELQGYGKDQYIKYRYIEGRTEYSAAEKIGITDRTGRNWKREIFEKAELIGFQLGIFK